MMQPSTYQAAILDWIKNGTGHGACNAVAGAGKSTTLRLVAEALKAAKVDPGLVRVMVFGKANSEDLKKKFDKTWGNSIATLHSTGWNLLKTHFRIRARQGKVTDSKGRFIGQDLGYLPNYRQRSAGSLIEAKAVKKGKDGEVLKLYNLLRLTNRATEAIADQAAAVEAVNHIIGHFDVQGIEDVEAVTEALRSMLVEGVRRADQRLEFDFTDQIWLPVHLQIKPALPYQFLLVDECQDLNAAQLELCFQLVAQNGRMLFVGDRRQAIYGFSGADHRSFQTIVDRTEATELPLSICYRCPRDHVRLVKRVFPEIPIEATENAEDGLILETLEAGLNKLLEDGDLVLGRKTAPLVSTCIQLIAGGIKAAVKGRDIGEQLKEAISTIAKVPEFQFDNFSDHLREYRSEQTAYYRKRGGESAEQLVEAVTDRCEAIEAIYKAQSSAKSTADLENYIDSLFSDDHQPVTLCTIHRAKGLEADRVFIIRPGDLPLRWERQLAWQLEQEENLLYVALTRSKKQLTIVRKDRKEEVPWYVELDDEDDETTVNIDSETVTEIDAENAANSAVEADSGNTKNDVFTEVMAHLQTVDQQIEANEIEDWNDSEDDLEGDDEGSEYSESDVQTGRQWVSLGMIAMPVNPDNTMSFETQSRVAMNGAIVEHYAEDMSAGRWEWQRDPVVLFAEQVPNGPVIYWVGDGHHRIAAANRAQLDMVFADVRVGGKREALFYSLAANRQHGLQRSNDDKRNAVRIALLDPEWTKMSDRAIAEHCGVSAPFVGKIRSELEESGHVEVTTDRVSKSGRRLRTANIGNRAAITPQRSNSPYDDSETVSEDDWGDTEQDDELSDDEPQAEGRRQDGSIDRRTAAARNGSGNATQRPVNNGKATGRVPKETPDDVVRLANKYGNRKLMEWLSWEMPMDELVKLASAIDGVLEGRIDSVAAGHSTEEW